MKYTGKVSFAESLKNGGSHYVQQQQAATNNTPAPTAQQAAMAAQQVAAQNNANARALVLGSSVDMWQSIFAQAINPALQTVVNVPINNVGLIKGFLVKVTGNIINNDGALTLTQTQFGASNMLSQIVFNDLNNTTRIQTTGWHMGLINSAKQPMVFGGAYTPNVPVNYGNNWTVMTAGATILHGANSAVQFYYYVPLAYSPTDLTGAMFAATINAQSTLVLTINPTPIVAAGGDGTSAIYQGTATGGWNGNVTISVWQNYLDQLPRYAPGQAPASSPYGPYILPQIDLSNIYMLQNSAFSGLVVGQNFNVPYANYRTFLSTVLVYDNAGVLNVGTDINYFALLASNTTQIFNYGPQEVALLARSTFMADPPKGVYYFSHRNAPIQTLNYGNMNLAMNPSAVTAGASLLAAWEMIANVSQVQFASALPNS